MFKFSLSLWRINVAAIVVCKIWCNCQPWLFTQWILFYLDQNLYLSSPDCLKFTELISVAFLVNPSLISRILFSIILYHPVNSEIYWVFYDKLINSKTLTRLNLIRRKIVLNRKCFFAGWFIGKNCQFFRVFMNVNYLSSIWTRYIAQKIESFLLCLNVFLSSWDLYRCRYNILNILFWLYLHFQHGFYLNIWFPTLLWWIWFSALSL